MAKADLLVHAEGTIYLLTPATRRGRRWIDEHVTDDRQEWAGAIVVEHRYIADIVAKRSWSTSARYAGTAIGPVG
jgi:hypothetical protein